MQMFLETITPVAPYWLNNTTGSSKYTALGVQALVANNNCYRLIRQSVVTLLEPTPQAQTIPQLGIKRWMRIRLGKEILLLDTMR
jgi:hypothetical protein